MDYNGGVYFAYDKNSNAIKIGKANIFEERLGELQVGNPNPLEIIHYIKCKSSDHSILLEGQLHKQFEHLYLRGEWFRYDEVVFQKIFIKGTSIQIKEKRSPLVTSTLFGPEEFGIEQFPSCYFYPHLTAQILDNYESALRKKVPFRTMKYPTHGKPMLQHYSNKTDKVFISAKKHQENLEFNRFNKFP
jgi:hypothetical protein